MLTKLKLTSLVLCSFLLIACSIDHHPSSHANNAENRERPTVFFIYDDDNHESERKYLEAISTFHAERPETEVLLVDKYEEQALVDELNLTEFPALVFQETGSFYVRASGPTSKEIILHHLRSEYDRYSLHQPNRP